jgi:hypothetical protein
VLIRRPLTWLVCAIMVGGITLPITDSGHAGAQGTAAGAAAPGGPPCNSSFDPYKYPPAALQACGIRAFPRQRTVQLSDGGTEYDYTMDGSAVHYRIPPAGFDPLTASSDRMSFYGLPAKPSEPSLLARWTTMMQKVRLEVPPANLVMLNYRVSHGLHGGGMAGSITDASWSGYYASTNGSGCTGCSTTVWASWNEFAVGPSCSGSEVTVWTGLGGVVNQAALAQDGTGYNFVGMAAHQAWYEITPSNAVPLALYAHPGYEFDAQVTKVTGGYQFYMYDTTTGVAVNPYVSSTVYDGNTADFIVERPPVHTPLEPLTNFYYEGMNGDMGSNYLGVGTQPWTMVKMTSNGYASGTPLADPTPGFYNSNQGFTDNYHNCQ